MDIRVYGDGQVHSDGEARDLRRSVWRGLACRCPACGVGKTFRAFAKVVDRCSHCGEELHHHRADDLPAYLVILVVGHVVVAAFMGFEALFDMTMWQHLAIWIPITILSSLAMLPPVKGGVVGLQWALKMHGFGGEPDRLEDHPELSKHES